MADQSIVKCAFADQRVEGADGRTKCSPLEPNPDNQWCFGCEHYVCENHAINPSLMGKHNVRDHLTWDD